MLDAIGIQRTRDSLRDHLNNVLRMVEGIEAGDRSFNTAVVTMTCNAAASACESAGRDIDVLKAHFASRLAPAAEPRVPRFRDGDLPRVASVGSL